MSTHKGRPARPEDCPTAWFAELELARERDDYARAACAMRELERLGVRVKFVRPRATAADEEGAR